MSAKLTTEQFIQKAQDVHGDRYDYSETVYVNARTKIKIGCSIHGVFEQSPANHLTGSKCPLCSGKKAAHIKAKSEFIQNSNLKHNNKYDYSLVEYVNSKTKVKILCPDHGSFEQIPRNHLKRNGCPHCAREEKGFTRTKFKSNCIKNNNGLGVLYVLECFNETEHFFKIGITSRSVQKRYKDKTAMPYNYRVIDEIVGDPEFIYDLETQLHRQHKEHHYLPTIPFYGSSNECFKIINNK